MLLKQELHYEVTVANHSAPNKLSSSGIFARVNMPSLDFTYTHQKCNVTFFENAIVHKILYTFLP